MKTLRSLFAGQGSRCSKAAQECRTPNPGGISRPPSTRASVLECGSPLPLSTACITAIPTRTAKTAAQFPIFNLQFAICNSLLLFALATVLVAISAPAATPIRPATTPATPSRSAAGNSYNPIFSADGRYLVFVSQANNLVTNDDMGLSLDVFVRDLTNQTNILVSVNTNGIGGGNFNADYPSISSNGQWIVFASTASNLVPNDTNGLSDVFVRDLINGTTRLVSLDFTGAGSASGKSSAPQISADGRWIFFESTATNLVSGQFPTNLLQVYARDLQAGATYLVLPHEVIAATTNLSADNFAVTADGRWLAFASTAPNLVVYAVTNQGGDIYVRNVQAGINAWASSQVGAFFVDSTNGYRCFHPVLSRDGAQVAFKATAGGTNQALVFWTELDSGNTFCVASNSLDNSWPELSADGRFLAFENGTNVFVWDSQQQSNRLVNVGYDGVNPGNGPAKSPVLSADGRTVLFLCGATDMAVSNAPAPSSNQVSQLYARNLESNVTWLVSANLAGMPAGELSEFFMPAVSRDGRLVAFECPDDHLVSGDQNRASDIFLRNLDRGELELISVRYDALPAHTGTGHAFIQPRCISGDGRLALISSGDNALGEGDTNQVSDLYLLDLVAGTNLWISVPTDTICTNNQSLLFPALSENGQVLAFLRGSPNYNSSEGFTFNLETTAMSLFNLNPTGGVAVNAFRLNQSIPDIFSTPYLALSSNGQWLAFVAKGSEMMPEASPWPNESVNNIYLRNLATGSNALITHLYYQTNVGCRSASTLPQFSPDGRWLSFTSFAADLVTNSVARPSLWVWDSQTDTLRWIGSYATNWASSPDSRYLAFNAYYPEAGLYLHDLYAASPTNLSIDANAYFPSLSYDAEYIAYRVSQQIYVRKTSDSVRELLSVAYDGVTPGNGLSEPPKITADGRFVVFASKASNLVPNDTNGCSDVFLRDRQFGLTYLLSANPKTGRSGNRPSTSPLLSSDGTTIIFASMANDLAEADYNDKQDIFMVKLARGDSDADGLDDAWEMAYFGNLAQSGDGDADGDGLKNREEYRAGTDPANQGSVLRALAMAPVGGQSTTLMWPAALGRQYQIQYKRSVTDTNWTDLPATVTVTGNTASAVDTQAGLDAARFYRILILP